VIGLNVQRHADSVSIVVENSFDPDTPSKLKTGLGLDNVRRRLRARYGDDAGVVFGAEGNRFSVKLHLPARQNGDRK
jgi:two-component system, LytTR family, sensor histidine kinase AlgZ